jgi:hypothetical protein
MKYKAENKIVPDGVNAKVILKLHTYMYLATYPCACTHTQHIGVKNHLCEQCSYSIYVNSSLTNFIQNWLSQEIHFALDWGVLIALVT